MVLPLYHTCSIKLSSSIVVLTLYRPPAAPPFALLDRQNSFPDPLLETGRCAIQNFLPLFQLCRTRHMTGKAPHVVRISHTIHRPPRNTNNAGSPLGLERGGYRLGHIIRIQAESGVD